jgi:hypothetical protein
MGHSSEKSGNTYNQRHVSKKANEISLMEQGELDRKAAEVRKETRGVAIPDAANLLLVSTFSENPSFQ